MVQVTGHDLSESILLSCDQPSPTANLDNFIENEMLHFMGRVLPQRNCSLTCEES